MPQEAGHIISFDFRKLHFILDAEANVFRKLKFPTKVCACVCVPVCLCVCACCFCLMHPCRRF